MGEGRAMVEVRDDGSGGARPGRGSGLSGLVDRVSALGGTLEIDSPVGAGTTIRARIPVTAPGEVSRQAGADVECLARLMREAPVGPDGDCRWRSQRLPKQE